VATSVRGLPLTPRAASTVDGATGPLDLLGRLVSAGAEVGDLLREVGADPDVLRAGLEPAPEPAEGLDQVLDNAAREADLLGHHAIDRVHLLMGLLYQGVGEAGVELGRHQVTLYDLRTQLLRKTVPPGGGAGPSGQGAGRAEPLPRLREAVRVSPAFLVPSGAMVIGGIALYAGPPRQLITPLTILFVAGGWVTSLCVHEFGHALVAYVGGDRAVAGAGYLSLNPLRYTHWLLSIVLPLVFLLVGGIGLPGGAVYINARALRSRAWGAMVSTAGPVGTLIFTLLIAWPFLLAPDSWFTGRSLAFWAALAWLVVVEVCALILNLLPIPPFDGFGIISSGLSWEARTRAAAFGTFGILIVFFLLWQGPVAGLFWSVVFTVAGWAHVPGLMADLGHAQMMLSSGL
jgi:Zn-dependent protease